MIKFRTSVFSTSFDLFVLLSRNNLALVGKFVSVANYLLSRIAHVYTAKTIVFLTIISQGSTRWRERGRTAFSGPARVNPSGPTHVSFHYGFERGRTGHMIIIIIIKFRYNARSDWLKERPLSEYRARSVEKWRTNLSMCFGILTNLTPIKRPLCLRQTKGINTDYMEAIVNNSSVKTVRNLQVMLSFRQTTDENTVIK